MRAEQSFFERACLASGLVSDNQLDIAWRLLSHSTPDNDFSLAEFTDDQLADQLVEMGYLNRWQVEQLRHGRTKFTLGSYRILDAIGHGGMGWVFKGEHVLLGRIEAIKVLPKSLSDSRSIASFLREIRAQAQLDHPNLVRLSYADKDGDTFFLVTEFVPGSDMRRLVHSHGPLTQPQAAILVSQAAEALAYAHEKGLVHRDVKPGNLLVTPTGHTKLTDLGLAFFSSDEETSWGEKPKHIVGTADYLAPEIIVTPSEVRPISDIYSLGCTLYYAVTGKVPFPSGDTADKLRRQLDETPLPPQRLNPEVDVEFAALIAHMMQKRPQERIATAGEVVERLRPWVEAATPDVWRELGRLAASQGERHYQEAALAATVPTIPEQFTPRERDAVDSVLVRSPTVLPEAEQAATERPGFKLRLAHVTALLVAVALGVALAAIYLIVLGPLW